MPQTVDESESESEHLVRQGPDNPCMDDFPHDRLDAYRVAVELLAVADQVAGRLPRGRSYLADQLRRAAASILLNLAEGAGEFAAADKARFYRMARRSATECASILDACRVLALAGPVALASGRALLLRAFAMLTAMILRMWAGSDSDADPSARQHRARRQLDEELG